MANKPPVEHGIEFPLVDVPETMQAGILPEPPYVWTPAAWGNYSTPAGAGIRRDASTIWLIVLHDTEGPSHSAIGEFQTPGTQLSAQGLTSQNGAYNCFMAYADIAYACGNWYYNCYSVSIEQERYGNQGYPQALLERTAREVAFLCSLYQIPCQAAFDTNYPNWRGLLRAGVCGHKHIPGADHTDPVGNYPWGWVIGRAQQILKVGHT